LSVDCSPEKRRKEIISASKLSLSRLCLVGRIVARRMPSGSYLSTGSGRVTGVIQGVFTHFIRCSRQYICCMRLTLLILLILVKSASAQPRRYDVIINEVMADPSPPALQTGGLPEVEYLELRNNSALTVDLLGWKISDQQSTATINVHFLLKPDSLLAVSSNAGALNLVRFGAAIGLANFPSLDNDGDLLVLTSKEGLVIHAVEYNADWFENSVKESGGWSLEMIDSRSPCGGAENWAACEFSAGGSPGRKNSVAGTRRDSLLPSIVRSYATDGSHVTLLFNKTLDETEAIRTANYMFEDAKAEIASAAMSGPLHNAVTLTVKKTLAVNSVYWLTVTGVTDCTGNKAPGKLRVRTGLAADPDSARLVINEILFNPVSPGVDYVEVLNNGEAIINLQQVLLTNRSASGAAGVAKQLSAQQRLIFPGQLVVLTEEPELVQKQFIAKDPTAFCKLSGMPSYPDDKGTVLLLNSRGKILDELAYDEKWHFALIAEGDGVSLERISASRPTADKNNWHSAAATSGYGTPTFINSQSAQNINTDNGMSVNPKAFSPDNDGRDDFATIQYHFDEPGYVANIRIYDTKGTLIKTLAQSQLCGREGYLRWDGLDNRTRKAAIGAYILVAEVFTLTGTTKKYKLPVVIATSF
jgi:hypothetical protein